MYHPKCLTLHQQFIHSQTNTLRYKVRTITRSENREQINYSQLRMAVMAGQEENTVNPLTSNSAQRWLLALAMLYTLYFARSLFIPVVLALLLASVLSPLVNQAQKRHIPRSVSAFVLLALIGLPLAVLGIELAEPAQKWMKRLPELGMELSAEFDSLTSSLAPAKAPQPEAGPESSDRGFDLFAWFRDREPEPDRPPAKASNGEQDPLRAQLVKGGIEVLVSLLGAAPILLVQMLTFLVLVLFQLIFGKRLYESAIELFPRMREKRRAVLAVTRVQRELSRYVLTVSLINAGLAIATSLVLWLLQVEDALLWGVVVGLLNFAPYIGPLAAICILGVAGLVQFGFTWAALIPGFAYFCVNLVEAQFVTPLVLGRHMRLNPLILVLWIIFWGWLWGAAGVLLAVPLLVSLKLVAQQFGVLDYWVRLIQARA
ncbi:AI-2E family transporter [Haliea sp. E17]|uniref:AI-2E family transporter n=1 Tax=Haliea sp. E17 TaxID=3401576 RepID=UPI003AB07AA7